MIKLWLTLTLICVLQIAEGYSADFKEKPTTPKIDSSGCSGITLYYSPHCPYSKQVLSHLKQMNKQVSLKNVMQDPTAKEELKKWGGRLEVPCLLIDGQPLYNSDAIIEWLDEHQSEF